MAVAKITKEMVQHPEVPETGHRLTWDATPGMSGFGIRVSPTGRVSFVVRYWTGTRQGWKTLGAYPRLNLTDAREKARKYLRDAGDGKDPVVEERRAQGELQVAEAQTVEKLAKEWIEWLPNKVTRRGRRVSPRTVEQYESATRLYIIPMLGSKPVSKVTRKDVLALHAKATEEGGPYSGNRAASILGIFYNYLLDTEQLPEGFPNPARRPPRNPEQRRGEHASVRLSPDQERQIVTAIYKLIDGTLKLRNEKTGRTWKHKDPVGGVALLTLLDTGRRHREVLRMEWRRLDLEAGTVDLGSTKGKAAGDVVYLTERVRDAIRNLPRVQGNPYVFHGRGKGGRRAAARSAWDLVKAEAGIEEISPDLEGFHLHDLRHHRISELLAAGVSPALVARQVGHTSLQQLRTYAHLEVADVAAVLSRLEPVQPARATEAR